MEAPESVFSLHIPVHHSWARLRHANVDPENRFSRMKLFLLADRKVARPRKNLAGLGRSGDGVEAVTRPVRARPGARPREVFGFSRARAVRRVSPVLRVIPTVLRSCHLQQRE